MNSLTSNTKMNMNSLTSLTTNTTISNINYVNIKVACLKSTTKDWVHLFDLFPQDMLA